MVDGKNWELFLKPHVDKQIKIETTDGKLTFKNKDIQWEEFELTESLCSESELQFGACEPSVLKFKIHNNFIPLKDKWLIVSETLEGNEQDPFRYGIYKVFSDIPTADRNYRDVTAYDAMYDIVSSSAIDWYNKILPNNDSKVTMKQFRTSFVEYFGLQQEEVELINDDMIVEKTMEVGEGVEIDNEEKQASIIKESALSGLNVISAICEINGCFGHIGRDGKFQYVYLEEYIQGLYPSNTLFPDHAPYYLKQSETGHLYPQDPKTFQIGGGTYISADYEDYACKKINKVQIRQEENDIGGQFPEGKVENENAYIIEGNFLVYGKSAEELSTIAKKILDKIEGISYRPFSAECIGNPCLEVGDPIRLSTKYELIESYILSRTFKGIQSPKDEYSAEGEEKRSGKANSAGNSIIQLKGKANILERTVEQTRSEIINVEEGFRTEIFQTAEEIRQEVENTKEGLQSSISQTAGEIRTEVSDAKEELQSSISQTAGEITQTIAGSERIWDTTGIVIDLYGYGAPVQGNSAFFVGEDDYKYGMKYLDQTSGIVYEAVGNYPLAKPPYTAWRTFKQLELITVSLESKIEQALNSIKLSVVNGKSSATLNLSVNSLDGSLIEANAQEIKFEGLVTFEDLSTSGKTEINGGNITASSIDVSKINVSTLYVEDELRIRRKDSDGNVVQRVALQMEEVTDQTKPNLVVGSLGTTNKVVVKNVFEVRGLADFESAVTMENNLIVEKDLTVYGEIYTNEIYWDAFDVRRGIKAEGKDDSHYVLSVEKDNTTIWVGFPQNSSNPTTTTLRGNIVQLSSAGSVTPSDERLKNSFKSLDEFEEVYMDIEPCAFKFDNGTSGRYHFGARAQNVRDALEKHGYTTQDFGGFVQMSDNPENEDYCGVDDPMGLIYTEFTMWNMHMVQKLYKKIEEQQKEIDSLKESISFLLGRMGD